MNEPKFKPGDIVTRNKHRYRIIYICEGLTALGHIRYVAVIGEPPRSTVIIAEPGLESHSTTKEERE
jgi:hypothetical protein